MPIKGAFLKLNIKVQCTLFFFKFSHEKEMKCKKNDQIHFTSVAPFAARFLNASGHFGMLCTKANFHFFINTFSSGISQNGYNIFSRHFPLKKKRCEGVIFGIQDIF